MNNILSYLENHSAEKAKVTAFIYLEDGQAEKESISYQELDRRAKTVSGYFQQNFEVDDRIILLLPNDLYFIAGVFGCMYAGVIPIPMHPINNQQTLEKCKYIVKDAGTNYVLSTKKNYSTVYQKHKEVAESWNWIFIEDIMEENLSSFKRIKFPENKVAFLQYTSGSTSDPKGVRVTHKSLLTNIRNLQESFGIDKDDIILSWLPFFHDMGIIAVIFQAVYTGIKCVFFPPMVFIQNPMRWIRAISKYRATVSGAPNFAYSLCAERIASNKEPLDLSCWKQAFCGAEPVKVDTFHKFRDEFKAYGFKAGAFYPGYGMAEATLLISGGVRGEIPRIIYADSELLKQNIVASHDSGIPIISCGTSISSHEIKIVDPNSNTECAENKIGEIWFSGDSVADGYWNIASDDAFRAKIAGNDKNFLRTGDLGFLNNGELFVTGRLKELIIVNGQNYFPKDIEELVEGRESRIRENCTAAFEYEDGNSKKIAFIAEIRRQEINTVNFEELVNSIRRILSEQMGLNVGFVGILSSGRLPKTTSGKIQRKLYSQLIKNDEIKFIYSWKNELEKQESISKNVLGKNTSKFKEWLKFQVAKTLKTDPKQIQNSVVLNQYGMDSLSAVGLSGLIEEFLNRPISPTIFYNYPTIDAITKYLFNESIDDKSVEEFENTATRNNNSDIAIIGMSVDFPNAKTLDAFWDNLSEGRNSICQLTKERLALHSPCRNAGFIDDVDQFDAHFFNISRQEAEQMDPQQRLLLQTSYHAIENALIDVSSLKGTKTGVFIGIGNSDYNRKLTINSSLLNSYSGVGNAFSIAANRLSYFYDFKGPSLAVDTACSSSLVAVHLGVNSLLSGESNMALIAGVNLILDNSLDTVFMKAGMLSDDFQCKTFDESANGYVRGEGCGMIVVKRLSDAVRDGNTIHAVIKGTAINQDGSTNGITAPNANSQKEVINEAVKKAGIKIGDIGYIETHGTGTSLGDPIEINALVDLLKESDAPCYFGSVKSNIGHLEFAAGIAGLIKTVLCLKNKKIPGNSNFKNLNPLINIDPEKIKIPKLLTDWNSNDRIRRAGVSSFGFGGTNAHVILEESLRSDFKVEKSSSNAKRIFAISAKSNEALLQLIKSYKAQINTADSTLEEICFTVNTKREVFSKRFAAYASSKNELLGKLNLEDEQANLYFEQTNTAFLFTGQGSQYAEMGRALYETYPGFKLDIDRCANWLKLHYSYDLLEIIFNPEKESELTKTQNSQLSIFVLEYALANFMISIGVKPKMLCGHSIGEYAAACIANVFSLEDALLLVYHRGKYMQELPDNGVMYSVISDLESIHEIIKKELSVKVAAYNSARQIVLSGEQEAVERVIQCLTQKGILSIQLKVSHAFHSELMLPASKRFHDVAKKIQFNKPTIPIVSTLTGKVIENEMSTADYWSKQIVDSVRFDQAAETLKESGINIFLEIGPSPVLTTLLKQIFSRDNLLLISCLKKSDDQIANITSAICELFVAGQTIDWKTLYPNDNGTFTLPLYPFQKGSYWLKDQNSIIDKDITSLIQQLELTNHFNKEEKDLLPKLIKSLKEISNTVPNKNNMLYKTSWKNIPQIQRSSTLFTDEQLIIIENNADQTVLRKIKNQCGNAQILSFDTISDKENVENGYKNLVREISATGFDLNNNTRIIVVFGERKESLNSWNQLVLMGLSSISMLLNTNSNLSCWIVTKDAISVDNNHINIANSSLWGAAKVLGLDYPQNFKGIINYTNASSVTLDALISNIFFEENEQYIHLNNDERFVYRVELIKEIEQEIKPIKFTGNYLISGGLGSLGLHVAEWLSKKGAKKIILLSRKSQFYESTIQQINGRMVAGTEIYIETCDVSSKESVVQLVKSLAEKSIDVHGVVHAAGNVGEYRPEEVTKSLIQEVVDTKIVGAVNLFEAFKESELEFYINFSSIASVWGSKNQLLYATGNHYLDAYATQLRQNGVNAYSINWGPWLDSSMIDNEFKLKLEQNGIRLLSPSEALNVLEYILQNGLKESIVADVDWNRFSKVYSGNKKSLIFNELVQEDSLEENTLQRKNDLFKNKFKSHEYSFDLKTYLIDLLQQMTHSALGHKSKDLPSINKGFFEIGFDSIMALDLKNKIQNEVGIILPNTLLFEHPNIHTLSVYLTNLLQEDSLVLKTNGDEMSISEEKYNNMSEAELADMLAEELKNV